MIPFQPSFPQGEPNMCTNQPHFPVQSNGNNPHFANNMANPYQMQNMQMRLLPQGQFFQPNGPSHPQGQFFANQFNFHQFPQHMNQMNGVLHGQLPGFPQVNPFNMPPCMHPSMGCGPPSSQNGGFHMNQCGMVMNGNQVVHNGQGQNMFMQSDMGGQSAVQGPPITGQQLQQNSPLMLNGGQAQMQHTQNNLQSNIPGKSQANHAKDNGSNIPNINQWNPQGNNFTTNQQESARFQKSPMTNSKGNFRSFKGKGTIDKGARNPHMPKCIKLEMSAEIKSSKSLASNYSAAVQKWREERRKKHPSSARSPASNYTAEEIQNWREERKKNHPSKSNTEKNSEDQTHSEDKAHDAQKRRQQLKEIMAKQAELGVEVAEIPKDYLLGSENQVTEIKQNGSRDEKGRSRKRGGRRQNNSRFNQNKKQKFGNNDQSPNPAVIKKKTSLLQKLLSADIKRDKSRLLQAFRFIVLNSFFVDCTNKPLEFPSVTVVGKDFATDVGKGAIPHQESGAISAIHEKGIIVEVEGPNELDALLEDITNGNDSENEEGYEHVDGTGCTKGEDSEEGEITD